MHLVAGTNPVLMSDIGYLGRQELHFGPVRTYQPGFEEVESTVERSFLAYRVGV